MNLENSIGEFLRQQRERRGATIEQVASATKINVRLVQAMESDQFDELPAKPFVRGFVISYCRFLGVDAKEVMARFSSVLDENCVARPEREAGTVGYAFEKQSNERSRTMLWFVMVGFILVGWVVFLILKPAFRHRRVSHVEALRASHPVEKPAAPTPSTPVVEAPAVSQASPPTVTATTAVPVASPKPAAIAAPAAVAAAPVVAPPDTATADPSSDAEKDPLNKGDALDATKIREKLVVKALANVWVRYKVDERPVMEFILLKDKLLVLKGLKQIRFQASNPKAAQVRYRGEAYTELGAVGHVKQKNNDATVVYPKELVEKIGEPFPEQKPLPETPDPVAQSN